MFSNYHLVFASSGLGGENDVPRGIGAME